MSISAQKPKRSFKGIKRPSRARHATDVREKRAKESLYPTKAETTKLLRSPLTREQRIRKLADEAWRRKKRFFAGLKMNISSQELEEIVREAIASGKVEVKKLPPGFHAGHLPKALL